MKLSNLACASIMYLHNTVSSTCWEQTYSNISHVIPTCVISVIRHFVVKISAYLRVYAS